MINFQISVTHVFQVFLFLSNSSFADCVNNFPTGIQLFAECLVSLGRGCPPHTHTQTLATPPTSWIILYSDLIGSVIIRYSCDGNESINDLQSFSILREVEDMLTGHFSGTCTGYHVHVKTKI